MWLALALWCFLAQTALLHAYTPIYTVKKTILQSDLVANSQALPMCVTGLNQSGCFVGYYRYLVHNGLGRSSGVKAFVCDASQNITNFSSVLPSGSTSMATCLADSGAVAGVYWQMNANGAEQLGFLWQGGTLTSFTAPGGNNIDTVTAVNANGQVIGTYFADGYAYKRAFLWDGIQSTDLSDLGDPDHSFVWPTGFNEAGQVVGTVYTEGTPIQPSPTAAFQWENGVMYALDADGDYGNSSALGINDWGEVIGTYLLPSGHQGNPWVASSFYWTNDIFTDLGSLGGGGTVPFFLGETHEVTGASYASDNTLHLFDWTVGAGALTDLGAAQLSATDTGFELTSVNQNGDAAGFVTDAQGQTQVFVRAGGGLYNLNAVGANTQGYTADGSGGTRAILNDAGLLACSGFVQGVPAVLLLTPDADGNGLPDGWERQYFPGIQSVNPGDDPDGDGLTNLQEYQQGSDPHDFYNGRVPILTIVGGGDQRGNPNSVLPVPLRVRAGLYSFGTNNAPMHFSVTGGGALLCASADGSSPAATLDVRATTPVTDPTTGYPTFVAQVWVKLPASNGVSTLSVTASSGSQTTTITTTAIASDPSVQPPTGFAVLKNTATTADIAWTPSDPKLSTVAEVSYDAQATWQTVATFNPGTTAGTVYHLVPDHVVYLRLYTASQNGSGTSSGTSAAGGNPNDSGGTGSTPTDGNRAELLSVPVVEGEVQGGPFHNAFFRGLQQPTRFTRKEVKQEWNEIVEDSGTLLNDWVWDLTGSGSITGGPDLIECDHTTRFTITSDITGWNWGADGNLVIIFDATLSAPYVQADFEHRVENLAFTFLNQRGDGIDTAQLLLQPYSEPASVDYLGPEEASDQSYVSTKLQYKFHCNADPNGQVVYDIIFTPVDGTPAIHDIHVIPTHGGRGAGGRWPADRPAVPARPRFAQQQGEGHLPGCAHLLAA